MGERSTASSWILAAADPRIDLALRTIHGEIAESTRAHKPLCIASGRCCRFAEFGHRLYVTGLETGWFLGRLQGDLDRTLSRMELDAAVASGSCPFLRDGLCSVHAIRPFACRTFFCDPRADAWQTELHERMHARVRALHDEFGIEYRYGEWREILGMFVEEAAG